MLQQRSAPPAWRFRRRYESCKDSEESWKRSAKAIFALSKLFNSNILTF